MPAPVSSTPILRTSLVWSTWATLILVVIGGVAGFVVAGGSGLSSALSGVVVGAAFLAITAGSILVANRWFGDALYVPIFFAIVLGGWLVKIVLFVVVMILLRDQPWVVRPILYLALVASVLVSLAIDTIVLWRLRVPVVSDLVLPEDPDAGDRKDSRP